MAITSLDPDRSSDEQGIARAARSCVVAFALLVLVLSVYWQARGDEFTSLDDPLYVARNPVVLRGLTGNGIAWAFMTFHAANWHPLTWLSHMLDVELFGPSPGWHYRMNVLLHLLNTELLFFVLWGMTGGLWPSALVAALFGVHPLHVESVAWIAERKDVLSTLFWILTMGAYLQYVRRPGIARYVLVTVSFGLGLLCKPMLVTLPFALLLLDWWPLGRMRPPGLPESAPTRYSAPALLRLASEKVPLLALAAMSCVMTYLAQARGGLVPIEVVPFGPRVSNALVSYADYLAKTAWPVSLAVFYPHPALLHVGVPAWKSAGALLALAGISAVALRQRGQRPYVAVGWTWYLGTLVPVIGLVQVGEQAMADRYTYVPLIGIFIAVAWTVREAASVGRFRRVALSASVAAVLALSAAARVQADYWRDNVTLFSRAVAVTERNRIALISLGNAYCRLSQHREGIRRFREALNIRPDDTRAWYNMGQAYYELGQYDRALSCYREVLRLDPGYFDAWNNLGNVFLALGRFGDAVDSYRSALRLEPGIAEIWTNLGVAYERSGGREQAIGSFREALRLKPDLSEARDWLNAHGGLEERSR